MLKISLQLQFFDDDHHPDNTMINFITIIIHYLQLESKQSNFAACLLFLMGENFIHEGKHHSRAVQHTFHYVYHKNYQRLSSGTRGVFFVTEEGRGGIEYFRKLDCTVVSGFWCWNDGKLEMRSAWYCHLGRVWVRPPASRGRRSTLELCCRPNIAQTLCHTGPEIIPD